jgi:hypothetical protein
MIDPTILLHETTSELAVQRAFGAFLAIQASLSQSNFPTFVGFIEILAKYKVWPLNCYYYCIK